MLLVLPATGLFALGMPAVLATSGATLWRVRGVLIALVGVVSAEGAGSASAREVLARVLARRAAPTLLRADRLASVRVALRWIARAIGLELSEVRGPAMALLRAVSVVADGAVADGALAGVPVAALRLAASVSVERLRAMVAGAAVRAGSDRCSALIGVALGKGAEGSARSGPQAIPVLARRAAALATRNPRPGSRLLPCSRDWRTAERGLLAAVLVASAVPIALDR
ncbi:MAG: hypothetical protein CMP23_02190 [Rickettsiales bacterium]|nr:hypothetical protein [Rickettsiales bacterium]